MKKIISFVLLVVLLFSLCACDPGRYLIEQDSLEGIVSVDLIEYENANQKHFFSWVPNHFDELVPFINENAKVIERLPQEKLADFLHSFSKTDILHTYYAYNSPKDICIRCNYENGNFLIIWANYARKGAAGYIGEYSADGTVLSFWGCFSALSYYEELVNEYFNYTLK